VPNADVFQVHRIHQVMQRDMRIAAAQSCQQRSHEAGKGHEGIAAERTEQQVEPDYVGLQPVQRLEQAERTQGIIERPAPLNGKPLGLDMICREFVGQDGKVQEWITLQLLCEVKPVFTQSPGAWRKGCDQTDLHSSPALQCSGFDVLSGEDVGG
jgi:hypothetical protein